MDPVALFLITIAGIFLIGTLGEIVFSRTGVPDVVWLILAGALLGPITGVVTRQQLGVIAPYFAALTLVVVLFEGGSRLVLSEVSRAAPRSTLLALLSFGLAVVAVAVTSMGAALLGVLGPEWTWSHGFLLGAILGGSSSIIIMPAMAQAKVEPRVANLVNLESAFTDAFCVVGASALIEALLASADRTSDPAQALLTTFGIGLGVGAVAGLLWLIVLHLLRGSDHAYPVTLSALLVLYVVIGRIGGSAALGILTFAVIAGNANVIAPRLGMSRELDLGEDVRGVHKQIAFIIKSFFFTFIGAMLGPPWLPLSFGVVLGGLLLLARIPAVRVALLGSELGAGERNLVLVALPRGMAAGVLATLPSAAGVPGTEVLPVIVFAAVLTTILTFAVGFPLARKAMSAPEAVAAQEALVQQPPPAS